MNIVNMFLDGLFQILNYILFVILVLLSIKLIIKTYKLIKKYNANSNEIKEFQKKDYSNKFIQDFSIEEFKLWCLNSLERQGYSNFKNKYKSQYLVCSKNNLNYLVYCYKNSQKSVSVDDLRNALGLMVVECVNNIILISPSKLSKSSKNFIQTLPSEYKIEFINLSDLHNKTTIENTNILQQT
ncbi:hypothetical protein SH2C18_01030 [Clostridium sediminicola]|uniref:restriction endonuclease n=1 Tax=Clostridium sediminicola TaxID=3114879 RepID=UPI0031F1F38F